MNHLETDILVLGAGAAGMGAALAASSQGAKVTLVERVESPGGILNQCIHNGFGIHYFKQELTGPEYAQKMGGLIQDAGVDFRPRRFLLDQNPHLKRFTFVSEEGVETITCKAFVYAAGARERPFGSLLIPGDRVSGIFTAGVTQRLVNLENRKPGHRVLILGSGDIGLIMARRLTLEGMEVVGVLERLPFPGGLERNIQQCLRDFDIPLHLSTTVAEVRGRGRLEEVTTVKVDGNFNSVKGSERTFAVDTLVLSVGLVPSTTPVMGLVKLDPRSRGVLTDNLGRGSRDWVFAAGNCVGIYDLADWVTREGEKAGMGAAAFLQNIPPGKSIPIKRGIGVGIVLPSAWVSGTPLDLFIRPALPHGKARILIKSGDRIIKETKPRPLSPGEMEIIKLTADVLGDAQDLTVEVLDEQ